MLEKWRKFKASKRGFYAFWMFLTVFFVSLGAEFVANDKPLVVYCDGQWYFPIVDNPPETVFGGEFLTPADYKDPFVRRKINENGFFVMPPIPYRYDTIVYDLPLPAPSAPSLKNWLGTDDLGRDVAARLIYGVRFSLLFGLLLTVCSSVIGIAAGAVQGYFGGKVDLFGQRFLEIWGSLPQLFILIIVSGMVAAGFGRCCSCCCCFLGRLWFPSFGRSFCASATSIMSKPRMLWARLTHALWRGMCFRTRWWRR